MKNLLSQTKEEIDFPSGQCHFCHHWKENAFERCQVCHKAQPTIFKKDRDLSNAERNKIISIEIKYMFLILKYVRFFVQEKFDFEKCNLIEVRNMIHDAFNMMYDPKYKSSDHPDLDLHDMVAGILYKLGIKYNVTQFIDDTTIMYGYGRCSSIGDFQFTIPHRFLKPGLTIRTYPVLYCDIHTKQEGLISHAYSEKS